MSEEKMVNNLEIKSISHGEFEEVALDFKASKNTINGRYPRKALAFIFLTIVVFIAYVWISTSIIDSLSRSTAEGTAGYHLQMGSTVVGMIAMYGTLKFLFDDADRKQKSDRFARRRAFAKDYLGPWLEANGGITETPVWLAEDIMNKSVYLKEEDNIWNAFSLEFVATGFNRQNQVLRIWRWTKE